MAKMIKIDFRNISLEVEENTKVVEIAKMCQKYFNYPIMLAKVDNDLVGLDYELTKKCDIEFYDRSSYQGNDVYSNSAYMIMILIHVQICFN